MILSHHDGPYQDILLYSLHSGEGYDEMFRNPRWRQGYARPFIIADFHHLTEAGLLVPSEWLQVLQESDQFIDMQDGTLFMVSGDRQAHTCLLVEFFWAVKNGPQGADDDTFDYWPGAVDMFVQYAKDLKALGNESVLAMCRQLGEANKAVPEWEDTAEILINLI